MKNTFSYSVVLFTLEQLTVKQHSQSLVEVSGHEKRVLGNGEAHPDQYPI